MYEGSYVLTQVFSLLSRQIFQRLVKKCNGDYRVRDFNCTNQLRYMLYGQLTAYESPRDNCLCLSAFPKSLYGREITTSVNESTLSCAKESTFREDYTWMFGECCENSFVDSHYCLSSFRQNQSRL